MHGALGNKARHVASHTEGNTIGKHVIQQQLENDISIVQIVVLKIVKTIAQSKSNKTAQ